MCRRFLQLRTGRQRTVATGLANLRPGDVAPIPAPRSQSSPLTDGDRIGLAISAFDRDWNHRDESGMAGLFMMNADWVDTAARWVRGNRDIAAHLVNVEQPRLKNPTLTSGDERLTLLHPDLAFAQVRESSRHKTPSSGHPQGRRLNPITWGLIVPRHHPGPPVTRFAPPLRTSPSSDSSAPCSKRSSGHSSPHILPAAASARTPARCPG